MPQCPIAGDASEFNNSKPVHTHMLVTVAADTKDSTNPPVFQRGDGQICSN